MTKVINKKTGVIKSFNNESEVSMYLATGEWELYTEKKEQKEKPVFSKEK